MKESVQECVIDRWNEKGQGRGIVEGRAVDVKGAFVGETAIVELRKGKRGARKGILQQILTPVAERQAPRCSHAITCGGCTFHGLSYSAQCEIKQETIQKLFPYPLKPMIRAKEDFGYRNKMEFSFSQDKEKNRYLGLILEDSRGKVFNQQDCALAPEWMVRTLKEVFAYWQTTNLEAYYLPANRGSLRTLTCREGRKTGDRLIALGVSGNAQYALNYAELEGFKEAVLRANQDVSEVSIFLVLTHIEKGKPTTTSEIHVHGKDHYEEELLGKRFLISPQAFFQPNPEQAAVLYQTAFDLLKPTPEDRVLDLYCGVGSIGICLKDRVASVLGIEINRYAVCDAKRNIALNQLSDIDVVVGDVKEVIALHQDTPFSIVIVDPPRAGLEEKVISTLGAMRTKKLLYISCNPKTLARDLPLLEAQGYAIEVVQPVDQFPQTLHVEMIAILSFKEKMS